MSGFSDDILLTSKDFHHFATGTIVTSYRGSSLMPIDCNQFGIANYPSRLNLMAVDPSRIAVASGRIYRAGEICLAIDSRLRVIVKRADQTTISGTTRGGIVRHIIKIFNVAIGKKDNYSVEIDGREMPHLGLGSSSRLAASVAMALNNLWGMPLNTWQLVRYLAANHGEETLTDPDLLVPVQCIGGGGIAGLVHQPFYVLAGDATLVTQYPVDNSYYVVLAYPEDDTPRDATTMMALEAKGLSRFYEIGKTYGSKISYRVFHHLLPAAAQGDWRAVGDVLDWYRYDLGSVTACSFCHSRFLELAGLVRQLRMDGMADLAGPSSVGPACYLMTHRPNDCIATLSAAGFRTELLQLVK